MVRYQYQKSTIDYYVSHYQHKRPIDWSMQFEQSAPLHVEIGFGLGEFMIRCAQENPGCNFVGIERDWKRLKKALNTIGRINAVQPACDVIKNIRVIQVDAVIALERLFEPKSIDQIYSLFPCPWPKKRHIKHRLFSKDFFKLLNSRLKDQGSIKIVTDYYPYSVWLHQEAQGQGFDIKTKTIDPQFDTKFERKWCLEGQREFF